MLSWLHLHIIDNINMLAEGSSSTAHMQTHVAGQLILQELQIEVQVGLGHGLMAPAGELGEDARRHVDNEAILTV